MNAETTLDFSIIKEQLVGYALSERARSRLLALTPAMKEGLCYSQLEETTRKARHQMSKHHVEGLVVQEERVKE